MSNTKKAYHEGEKFAVYVIRRGWFYWTGTRFDLCEYNARCYGLVKDAKAVIEKRKLVAEDRDEVQIVKCTLTVGVPVTDDAPECLPAGTKVTPTSMPLG